MRRLLGLALLAGLLLASPPALARPGDLLIVNRGFGLSVLGPMRPQQDATRAAAVRAFGNGYQLLPRCRMRWPAIGLTVQMENFGTGDPCAFAQSATIAGSGSARWRTVRGLRVGSTVATLQRLYPAAERHGASWTLASAVSPFGDRRRVPVVWALVAAGRVTAIRGWVGGAGD